VATGSQLNRNIRGDSIRYANMNITLRQLRFFLCLANTKNFTTASRSLYISQPALTRAIQELESHLSLVLFNRTTRKLSLTEDGLEFRSLAMRLVQDFDFLMQSVADRAKGLEGNVSIAVGTGFGSTILPGIIANFRKEYPQIGFTIFDDTSGGIIRRISSAEIDFGIGSIVGESRNILDSELLLRSRLGVMFHPDLLSMSMQEACSTSLEMLAKCLAGLCRIESGNDTSIADILYRHDHILGQAQIASSIKSAGLTIQCELLNKGLGYSIVSEIASKHPLAQRLLFVPIEPALCREIFLLSLKARTLSPACLRFGRYLIAMIREGKKTRHDGKTDPDPSDSIK